MDKLLLLSPLIVTILIPALASRGRHARHGLKLALAGCFAYFAFWVVAMRFVWPRLLF